MHVGSISQLRGDYAEPVARLRAIGFASVHTRQEWPDYVAEHGFGEEHVGELIRMVGDASLLDDADVGDADVWAAVHAWRALGQLRAEAAIGPLVDVLRSNHDDAVAQELPAVFGMIGPAAIAALTDFLAHPARTPYSAATAMDGLKEIAERHPVCRDACVGAMARRLEPGAEDDPSALGFVVGTLIDLAAVEAIDAIRAAYARDAVDMMVPGDLEDVEIALGLRQERATPPPRYGIEGLGLRNSEMDGWGYARQEPIRSVKIGRNAPCPCGSGKKYKKCCLE